MLVVPTRKSMAVKTFIEKATQPQALIHTWHTFTDSGRQSSEQKKMIDICVIVWVANPLRKNWRTIAQECNALSFNKQKTQYDPVTGGSF